VVVSQFLLDDAEPRDAGTSLLSSPVHRRGGLHDPLGICIVIHACNVPKQSKSVRMDYCSEFWIRLASVHHHSTQIGTI